MQTSTIASFTYDGDGRQVKAVVGGVTTYYVGAHYQVDNGVVTKYYFAGAQRVAMRKNGTLSYLLADHLGSTSLTTNTSGAIVSELRYKAWGETRYSSGTMPTSYRYTGQREEPGIGLYFYNARWYDPCIMQFNQPDSLIPDPYNTLDWNRYTYARNNPLKYTDPSGHSVDCGIGDPFCSNGKYKPGGLISLYKLHFGADALGRPYDSPKPIRERLSQEIEDYLRENSDYDFRSDNLLGGSTGGSTNYGVFSSIRIDYWKSRCMDSCNGGDLLTEPEKLYRYYDLHENIQIRMFDPSRIDWIGTGLDTTSLILSVVALNALPQSAKALYANRGAYLTGGLSGGNSFATGDNTGGWLSVGGFAPPPFGTLASGASVFRDFSKGIYYVPYIPPIPR